MASPNSLDNQGSEINIFTQSHTAILSSNINHLFQTLYFSSILFCEFCKLKWFIKYR